MDNPCPKMRASILLQLWRRRMPRPKHFLHFRPTKIHLVHGLHQHQVVLFSYHRIPCWSCAFKDSCRYSSIVLGKRCQKWMKNRTAHVVYSSQLLSRFNEINSTNYNVAILSKGATGGHGDGACYEVSFFKWNPWYMLWVCTCCNTCATCQVRLADECKARSAELEDLYKKLMGKQKDHCVVGIPDRPSSLQPWTSILKNTSHLFTMQDL